GLLRADLDDDQRVRSAAAGRRGSTLCLRNIAAGRFDMSKTKKGAVGVIGLGIMGGAFARNLAAAGWQVKGFDLDPARCAELSEAGVEIASDVAAIARAVPTIITSLPAPKALEQVAGE